MFSGHTKRERQKEEATAEQRMTKLVAMVEKLTEQNAELLKDKNARR